MDLFLKHRFNSSDLFFATSFQILLRRLAQYSASVKRSITALSFSSYVSFPLFLFLPTAIATITYDFFRFLSYLLSLLSAIFFVHFLSFLFKYLKCWTGLEHALCLPLPFHLVKDRRAVFSHSLLYALMNLNAIAAHFLLFAVAILPSARRLVRF